MRAVLVAALGCLALAGCDQLGFGQHVAQISAAPPCHCATPPAPVEHMARLAAPAEHHRHHHRHYAESSHSYSQSWADAYEDQSSSDQSESREYDEGNHNEGDYDEDRASHEDVWVDGYGREHAYSHVTRVADSRERLDPWHAYKSKCGDRERE